MAGRARRLAGARPRARRLGGRRVATGRRALLLSLLPFLLAAPVAGQEIPPVDSLVAPDTTGMVGDTTEAQEPRRTQAFPSRRTPGSGIAADWECDRDCLLANPELTLVDLLERHVPGLVPLRGGYFGGPHHVLYGALGPSSLRVTVDGRELAPLESGQVDLTRIGLVQLDRVRVVRRTDEALLDLTTYRHDTPVAYSRITAGTGQPGAQVLRGVFANGLGRDLTLGGWVDLLDVTEPEGNNDRLEFRGRASWMPGTNRLGVQLEYGSQTASRTAADSVEFSRREILLRARADLSETLQAEVRVGTSKWGEDAPPGLGNGDGVTDGDGEAEGVGRSVREAAVGLRADAGALEGAAELRFLDAAWQPSVAARGGVAWRPFPLLALEAGAAAASWDEFGSAEVRAGLLLAPDLPVPLRLRADAATGTRGVARPLEEGADSLSFDAFGAGLEAELGPYRIRGRASLQRLSRRLPFGDAFDRVLAPGGELEATGLEAGIEGPILPVGALIPGLEPIRFRGWWRRIEPEAGEPFYLPDDVLVGELAFHDTFFDGELELRLVGHVTRRAQTLSARVGEAEPVALPAHTWGGGHFTFRVGSFRFWYKTLNPAGLGAQEVADVPFPSRVNVVGVHWEFRN